MGTKYLGKNGGSSPGERRGGRTKGTCNRITTDFLEGLREQGYDPVTEIINSIYDVEEKFLNAPEDLKPQYMAMLLRTKGELLKYIYPQRKAVDHTTAGEKINSLDSVFRTILITNES